MNICVECRRVMRLWFLFAVLSLLIKWDYNVPLSLFSMIAAIILFTSIGVWSSIIEIFTLYITTFIFYFFTDNIYALMFPIVSALIIIMAIRSGRIFIMLGSFIFMSIWCYMSIDNMNNYIDVYLIIVSILNMALNLSMFFNKRNKTNLLDIVKEDNVINNIDSYIKSGADKVLSSLNHINIEKPVQISDGLCIAFQVKWFSPNIKFLYLLFKNLPKVKKKPVFLIYQGAFFTECAFIPVWILLKLKGYDVMGRVPYIEALNELKALNINTASEKDFHYFISESTADILEGYPSGYPFLIYPLMLFIPAFIVNIILYKLKRA